MKNRDAVWYNQKKFIRKRLIGAEYKDHFVTVKILGTCFHETEHGNDYSTYLIELPNKERRVAYASELFRSAEE